MRKKLISLLLSLSICLSFMSMAAFADETVYNVWVNGDRFTSNCLTIQCGDGTAKFNPQTNELTLTNATITKDYFAAGIYCNKEDLTVILVGNNSIKTMFYGINLYRKSLTITGKGNLSIENTEADGIGNGLLIDTNDVGEDITIDIEGTLSIKSNDNCIQTPKTVNILGNGKIDLESNNYGIYNHDDVLISGKNEISISCDESGIRTIGKISVSGENKITINAKDIGMSAESGIDFTNSGSITIDANTGLYSNNGSVKQSGKGSLTITSQTEGIRVKNDIILEGDSQTIDINSENFGLWSDEGNITFSGNGNIDIKSTSPAIFSNCGNFSILGSDLVLIESEQNAVLAKGAKISHDGLVEISSNRGIEIYDNGITFSGLGETNIYSTYSCINLNNGSNIVFGEDSQYISGNIEISSTNGNAITFASDDCTAEINGNAHNISLNSAPGYKVISDSNNKKEYSIDVKNPEVYDITGSSTESSAQYKLKFYFIIFDMNGHGTPIGSQLIVFQDKVVKPENPSETGFKFEGWYTNRTCSRLFYFDTAITEDLTLYAKWTVCNHSSGTKIVNQKDATTTSAGYTGDTCCKECGFVISSGSNIPTLAPTPTTAPTTTPGGGTGSGSTPTSNPTVTVAPTVTSVPTAAPTSAPTSTVAPTAAPSSTPTVAPTTAPELNVGDFINRCYSVALGREADEGGYNYWVESLTGGQTCGAQVGYGFIFSQEYINKDRTNEEFVTDMYAMYFGRSADSDGFNYWVDLLESGLTREDIMAGFANSEEFYNLCNKYGVVCGTYLVGVPNDVQGGVNCFVARMYKVCLNRLPDMGGQSGWVLKLMSGDVSGTTCAYGFVFSPEFIGKNPSNEDFVNYMYAAFFGREADEAGFNAWVDTLNNGGSYEDVFKGFSGSAEFFNLCAGYGIQA